jgi:hypothetical protein
MNPNQLFNTVHSDPLHWIADEDMSGQFGLRPEGARVWPAFFDRESTPEQRKYVLDALNAYQPQVLDSCQPDPAAEFGAALSLFNAAETAAEMHSNNLSDAYSGGDEFMRQCMRVGREFEAWACAHVDFDELADVWPYDLHDRFGRAAIEVIGSECRLHRLGADHWPLIADVLKLPLRNNS